MYLNFVVLNKTEFYIHRFELYEKININTRKFICSNSYF